MSYELTWKIGRGTRDLLNTDTFGLAAQKSYTGYMCLDTQEMQVNMYKHRIYPACPFDRRFISIWVVYLYIGIILKPATLTETRIWRVTAFVTKTSSNKTSALFFLRYKTKCCNGK